ncbi:MAG TPA: PaaI family thioesterase [Myxococcaceae bacterium]|jgi:uncharacterized protein (TIGR00369 family)
METFRPADPEFEARVRDSFSRQAFMSTLGARLARVAAGEVQIELPFQERLTQQHGFLHAGAVAAIVDSACGYSALTLMPPGVAVLTTEYKVNLVAPASGEAVIARGSVLKAGRTLTVVRGDAFAVQGGREKLVATMLATVMTVRERGIVD